MGGAIYQWSWSLLIVRAMWLLYSFSMSGLHSLPVANQCGSRMWPKMTSLRSNALPWCYCALILRWAVSRMASILIDKRWKKSFWSSLKQRKREGSGDWKECLTNSRPKTRKTRLWVNTISPPCDQSAFQNRSFFLLTNLRIDWMMFDWVTSGNFLFH